jgi:hypothetical protein
MARYKRFTFLCNAEERRMLTALSNQLQRSESDSVRWLIREAARELEIAVPDKCSSQPHAPTDKLGIRIALDEGTVRRHDPGHPRGSLCEDVQHLG